MPVFNNILAGAAGQSGGAAAGYKIERSLRFNSGDSAYLDRDFATAGNQQKMTFSFWIKRTDVSSADESMIIGADYLTSPTNAVVDRSLSMHFTSGQLKIYDYGASDGAGNSGSSAEWTPGSVGNGRLFRDPSAWYHCVFAIDTTQATAANRCKVWINGEQETFSNPPPQDAYLSWGQVRKHYIGIQKVNGSFTRAADFNLAEFHFVDGQALAESDFGKYDDNNVWQPKEYSGTYGTNGFHLDFSDNSSNASLGTDSSGNSNTWTVNNLTAVGLDANTSQTWSNSATGYHSGAGAAFDGDFSTSSFASGGNNANAYVDITAINASKVEVYVSAYGSGSAGGYWYARQTDGTEHRYTITSSGTSLGWVTVYDGSQIQINRLGGARDSDGDAGSAQYAWKVDGKILIDSGTSGASVTDTDSLLDSPTNYEASSGNNGGNYATLNPITPIGSNCTFSNGNLDVSVGDTSANGNRGIRAVSTIGMTSGKWYCEHVITGGATARSNIGVTNNLDYGWDDGSGNYWIGSGANDYIVWSNGGNAYSGSGQASSYGVGWGTNDVIGCAFDADEGKMYIYKNGTVMNSGTPSHTGLTDGPYFFIFSEVGSNISVNFGQRPFAHLPSGFKALCTQNFDDPPIAKGSTHFDIKLWEGDDDTNRAITGLNFRPDFLWIKSRSAAGWHALADSVRGAGKILASNEYNSEYDNSDSQNAIKSFTSDGFTIGHQSGWVVNNDSTEIVGWAWNAPTSFSNSAGSNGASIASSGKANQSAGFSIVTYTGTGSNGTIKHGLNAAPGLVIVKKRSAAGSWTVWHEAFGTASNTDYIYLDSDTQQAQNGSDAQPFWNNTVPTSNVVSLGTGGNVNGNTATFVAYCFAPVEGYSAFGSFDSTNTTDNKFVYLGFRPRWVLWKRSSSAGGWFIYDAKRDPVNAVDSFIPVDTAAQESEASPAPLDFVSNGFKVRNGLGGTETFIYAAFAENPFKIARAR